MTPHDMSWILSDDLLASVARRTVNCDFTIWGFGVGPALVGMLRAGQLLGDDSLVEHVAELVHPKLIADAAPTDHLISVEALSELQRLRPDLDVRDSIKRFVVAIRQAERPAPGAPAVHRPDLEHLSRTVWVDCMHTDGPGLEVAGYSNDSLTALEEASLVLQDESGLFSHAYDVDTAAKNGVHWGRGQGWALHGLILGARSSNLDHRLDALLGALARTEADGAWRTIVDDSVSPFEASVSAIVASGILTGVTTGRIHPRWVPLARRALLTAVDQLDPHGGLFVSGATPAGPPAAYHTHETAVYPWGQGPLLLALLEGRNHL